MSEDHNIRGSLVLVLLSGGIDSTATLAFYLELGCLPSALFVDYGQDAATRELAAAQRVAAHYRVPLQRIACPGKQRKGGGLILGRNALLLSVGLMELEFTRGIIAIGVHAGTRYFDCSARFVSAASAIFDGYTDGRVKIGAPFLEWSKPDIWAFCRDRGVPLSLTYSCELGREQPCGECDSCKDLEVLSAGSQLKN